MFKSGNPSVIKGDLTDALIKLVKQTGFKSGLVVELILVDDEATPSRMHGRYLLSIKGGIRFDQGFQILPAGRQVDVEPVGKAIHDDLFKIFFENQHEMKIIHRFAVTS